MSFSLPARCLLAATVLVVTACGETPAPAPAPAGSTTTPSGSGIEVRNARVQVMTDMGAAYLQVVNTGGRDDRLVRVETTVAAEVDAHETVIDDGVMRMKHRPNGFVVPAGGELLLEPGGKHLMLTQPEIADGQTEVSMTLWFEHHEPIEVQAKVVGVGTAARKDPSN